MLGINPVTYQWNGLGGFKPDGRDHVGIIANQVQGIIPEAIYSERGKLHATDAEETDILYYELPAIVMTHTNAIKELVHTADDLLIRMKRLEDAQLQL